MTTWQEKIADWKDQVGKATAATDTDLFYRPDTRRWERMSVAEGTRKGYTRFTAEDMKVG